MKKVFFFVAIISVFFSPKSGYSQPEPNPTLKLKIVDHSGGMVEPIFLRIELIFPRNEIVEGYPIVNSEQRPILEYKHISGPRWRTLEGSQVSRQLKYYSGALPRRQQEIFSLFTYPVGESYKLDLVYPFTDDGDFSRNYLFESPGTYLIRLKACPFYKDGSCLYSTIDTLVIEKYDVQDKRAINSLKKVEPSTFFYEPFLVYDIPVLPDYTDQAVAFLEKFGNSKFAHWVRYYIAYRINCRHLLQDQGDVQDFVFARTLLEEILKDPNCKNELLKEVADDLYLRFEVYINTNNAKED